MPQNREYPYQDGDVTVLGPETFASKDDTVISWRGNNYVRHQDIQPTTDGLTAGAIQELASAVRDLSSSIRLESVAPTTNVTLALGDQPITEETKEAVKAVLQMTRRTRGVF
jgi:inosine-uridine nucleoside N-ribohydrolase